MTGQTEEEIADYIQRNGPSTLIDLADEVGITVGSVRVHVSRICVKAGTAPDRKSVLYKLKEDWHEHLSEMQGNARASRLRTLGRREDSRRDSGDVLPGVRKGVQDCPCRPRHIPEPVRTSSNQSRPERLYRTNPMTLQAPCAGAYGGGIVAPRRLNSASLPKRIYPSVAYGTLWVNPRKDIV